MRKRLATAADRRAMQNDFLWGKAVPIAAPELHLEVLTACQQAIVYEGVSW